MLFRSSQQQYADLGFGAVFDGSTEYGQFSEISTQAVIEMMRHVDGNSHETATHVEISALDVDKFGIQPSDEPNRQLGNASGKI